jgi:hypothetical protein
MPGGRSASSEYARLASWPPDYQATWLQRESLSQSLRSFCAPGWAVTGSTWTVSTCGLRPGGDHGGHAADSVSVGRVPRVTIASPAEAPVEGEARCHGS